MSRFVCLCALATLTGSSALAAPIGYAQATGYYKKSSRPTLYQPLNLLDGREITAWCTQTADPLNDTLTFGFKGPTKIDELRIYTGNGFDGTTFQEFSRAKRFTIRGPEGAQSFTVADQRGLQAVGLNPPLVGAQFRIEVVDLYPAEDPEQPVCVTDIIFYNEGKPLNGTWLTQKLKYDRSQAPYLGTWFAGYEGAPDRFLSFYFDGTYRYVYEPFDKTKEKPKTLQGSYDAGATRITFDVGGKKVSARARVEKGESKGLTLTLEGDLPPEFKHVFRSEP